MNKGPVSQFILHHYRHFNAAALVDAAKGYEKHLEEGGKMMVTIAGAMSTAELGISLAEMIRQDKVSIISCTGANLEEDVMNLVAHSHYKRVPNYRDARCRSRLTEGLVITIEPIVCAGNGAAHLAKDGWTIRTADASLAAHFEHTIVITKTEPIVLTAAA